MNVSSGPKTERIVRNSLFMLMCLGMGGWFIYDGFVGYINKNKTKLLEKFPTDVRRPADEVPVYTTANLSEVESIKSSLDEASLKVPIDERKQTLEELFGGPPSIETDDAIYYFGQDALLTFRKDRSRINLAPEVAAAEKTFTDFQFQKRMGYAVGAIGLYMLYFVIRVMRTRADVTDEGLSINGRKPIPFDAMKSLDVSEFRKKGRCYIICEGNPAPRVLMDEYHYADYASLMAAICEKAGFEDPVAKEKADKTGNASADATS